MSRASQVLVALAEGPPEMSEHRIRYELQLGPDVDLYDTLAWLVKRGKVKRTIPILEEYPEWKRPGSHWYRYTAVEQTL